MLIPRVPPWAVAAGVPPPVTGESFEEFCRRIEIPEWVIAHLLEGLEGRTLEVANARLSSHLALAMPDQFRDAVSALDRGAPHRAAVLRERYS